MTKRQKYIISATLIIVGVCMTVLSAVMNNYLVSANNDKIEQLQNEAQSIDQIIDQLWQNYQLLEQKKDTATLLLAMKDMEAGYFIKYLQDMLLLLNTELPDAITTDNQRIFSFLLDKMQAHKQLTIDRINDIYADKLDLQAQSNQLDKKNSTLGNIALFFQIMGLILVLSKHLFD